MKLTRKEEELLALLKSNARMSVTDMAAQLGISRSTIQGRLERLEASGVIEGYTLTLSSEYEGAGIQAYVSVVVQPQFTERSLAAMKAIDGVMEILSVSGPFDFIVLLSGKSINEIDIAIDGLLAVQGIERTTSSVVLSRKFKRNSSL